MVSSLQPYTEIIGEWVKMGVLRLIALIFCSRIRKVAKDDLVGLHLWLWQPLWTLPGNQFCVSCRVALLVLHQTLQEYLILTQKKNFDLSLSI